MHCKCTGFVGNPQVSKNKTTAKAIAAKPKTEDHFKTIVINSKWKSDSSFKPFDPSNFVLFTFCLCMYYFVMGFKEKYNTQSLEPQGLISDLWDAKMKHWQDYKIMRWFCIISLYLKFRLNG